MIAKQDTLTDIERILALMERYRTHACVNQVFSDIDEIQRLLEYYSFRTPQLADRYAEQLLSRYRYEIFALYGMSSISRRQADSSYLRLQQLLSSLARVALMRLCCEGALALSHSQIASSDGLLYLTLRNAVGHG